MLMPAARIRRLPGGRGLLHLGHAQLWLLLVVLVAVVVLVVVMNKRNR
jgi:hypothetical protein